MKKKKKRMIHVNSYLRLLKECMEYHSGVLATALVDLFPDVAIDKSKLFATNSMFIPPCPLPCSFFCFLFVFC